MKAVAVANPDLTVVKLDASKARRQCMALQVRGLPTLLLYQDGQEMARITDTNLGRRRSINGCPRNWLG